MQVSLMNRNKDVFEAEIIDNTFTKIINIKNSLHKISWINVCILLHKIYLAILREIKAFKIFNKLFIHMNMSIYKH